MKFKRLTLSGLMMTVMSMTAHAAGSAPVQQLDMKASLSAQTCTIADLNKTFVLPDVVRSQFSGVNTWNTVSTAPGYKTEFSISNCPASLTKVNVTADYEGESVQPRFIKNKGTAVGFAFDTGKDNISGEYSKTAGWEPGMTKKFTLTNGAVDVPFKGKMSRNGESSSSEGTLEFDFSMVFDFL